jgi:Family of unknown function (DUF6228)
MDSFPIRSASGAGSLEFFERTPADARLPIERFKVRLTDHDLAAVGRVYVGPDDPNPALLFARMAADWRGWSGELAWDLPEGELGLRCARDRTGHVAIRVELRSGPGGGDWTVRATVVVEAGQLEELSRQAASFFG